MKKLIHQPADCEIHIFYKPAVGLSGWFSCLLIVVGISYAKKLNKIWKRPYNHLVSAGHPLGSKKVKKMVGYWTDLIN